MEKMAFSDECKFSRVDLKSTLLVRRKKGEKLAPYTPKPSVQRGGGSMSVWGYSAL